MNATRTTLILAALLLFTAIDRVHAAREVTVKYLNAAISSLPDKEEITLKARYGGDLHKTPLWQGHSQFSLVAPDSNATFTFAVCQTGDPIFDGLLEAEPGTLYQVEGVKFKLSGKFYDCLIVTGLELLAKPEPETAETKETVRVTITHPDGTKETVRNLSLGDTHTSGDLTIQVDVEK